MPIPLLVPGIIAGISALGGLFGNRGQQQETTQSTDSSSNSFTGGHSSSTPQYDELTLDYRNKLLAYLQDYLGKDPSMSGYLNNGLETINQASKARSDSVGAMLAARGLSSSPVAANALINEDAFRVGQGVQFQNQIPLLAEQQRQQRLGQFTNFFSSLPVGSYNTFDQSQNSTSTQRGKETQTTPGNMAGGFLGGLGTTLAGLYGKGAFQQQPGGNL